LDEMRATSIIIVNDIDSHGIVSEPRVRMADKIDLTTVHALLMYRHGRNTAAAAVAMPKLITAHPPPRMVREDKKQE